MSQSPLADLIEPTNGHGIRRVYKNEDDETISSRYLSLHELKDIIAQEIATAVAAEREIAIARLEACLMGTHDVMDLDFDPSTKHITTIKEIRDHIQMHIDLAKEKELPHE